MITLNKFIDCLVKPSEVDLNDIEQRDYMFFCSHIPHAMYRKTMLRLKIEQRRILCVVKAKEYNEYLKAVDEDLHNEMLSTTRYIADSVKYEKQIKELQDKVIHYQSKIDSIQKILNNQTCTENETPENNEITDIKDD